MGGERATTSDSSTAGRPRWICSGAIWTAVAAGGFSLVVCAVLTAVWVQTTMDDPLDSPELRSLQAALRSDPGSEPVKQRIRRLDLQLRHEYFRRQRRMNVGSYSLASSGRTRSRTSRDRPPSRPTSMGRPGSPHRRA